MRTCTKCGETKPLDQMVKGNPSKYKDGRRNQCNSCNAARMRKYFSENPKQYEKNKAIPRKKRPNWKRHGITEEVYTTMFNLYDGKCHSCKIRTVEVIDHDHQCCSIYSCGKCVRGLLCKPCNISLGYLEDSPDQINCLLAYITAVVVK